MELQAGQAFDPVEHVLVIETVPHGLAFMGYDSYKKCTATFISGGLTYDYLVVRPRPRDVHYMLDWCRAHPGEVCEGSHKWLFRWHANELQQRPGEYASWELARLSVVDFDATYSPLEAPQEGSREAVAASPEGTCWWSGKDRKSYFRRRAKCNTCDGDIEQFDTLTGESKGCPGRNYAMTGWSPCIHHGQPAEPTYGSQFWAQVVTRYMGKKVCRPRTLWGTCLYYEWDGNGWRFMYEGSGPTVPFTEDEGSEMTSASDSCQSGWSLYQAPQERMYSRAEVERLVSKALAGKGEA
jgi:hypothetical protein